MNNKVRNIVASLALLMLFIAYQACITAFTHVHYVNGVLITHSHPFNSQHSHSKTELVVIDRLAQFHSLEVDGTPVIHPYFILLEVIHEDSCVMAPQLADQQSVYLRAPPFLSV